MMPWSRSVVAVTESNTFPSRLLYYSNMAAVGSLLILLVLQLLGTGEARRRSPEVGGVFRRCRRGDPQLGECVVHALNAARPALRKGVPSLGLPPLGELHAKEIGIEEGPDDLHLSFRFRDLSVTGLDDYVFTRARVVFDPPYVELVMTTPSTRFRGKYTFGGHLLALSISGDGDGDVDFGGLNVTHRIYLQEEKRDGKVFWKVREYLYDMQPETIKVDFKNLFNGNKELGTYANNFINDNWRPLYYFYRRGTVSAFGTPMKDYANAFLSHIPLSELFSH